VAIITLENVTKVYRTARKQPGLAGAIKSLFKPEYTLRTAIDALSLSIDVGEVVGYIGTNGAGKSTTIKVLTGILAPTSGSVRVLGRDPHRQRIANARDIGVVFGQRSQLWWDLALQESLDLIARIYQVPEARYRELLSHFIDTLDLGPLLTKPVRSLSLGQKMRAELAATLLHEPKVVYLDEPTIGLDIVAKERIREFIKQQNRAIGTTVLLTTHDLGDIEELCSRVVIIDAGHILYDGSLDTIKQHFGLQRSITFETTKPVSQLKVGSYAELSSAQEHTLVVRFDGNQASAAQVITEVMSQVEVLDLSINEPDLGAIIKQIHTRVPSRQSMEA
jgi:ABC-2 type transport system ATP-binding protein